MKFLSNPWTKILSIFIIFILVLIGANLVIPSSWNSIWSQGFTDFLIFAVLFIANIFLFHQKIHWFSGKDLGEQFYTTLPTFVFVLFLDIPMLLVQDFSFKINVVVMCILVGLTEEYVFRGLLIPLFLKIFHNQAFYAVLGSAFLFGIIHSINLRTLSLGYVAVQVLFAMTLGVLFGAIYVKTHNLTIVIVLHMLKDVFPLLSPSTLKQAASVKFSMASLIFVAILLFIAIYIAYRQISDTQKAQS
ncbi:CPBP family intramembrane glutamic endopeptidase [Companilactobacillus mishanensis]|uniref:CPBP family intramembrane glutamic endopeptidase n=1 Tax=Companilactobacillus mishanensis TaxID=2486008 RepID=UPI001294A5D2|nr:CPBP family intramembrane glutamic endopeptidase [Companilactobacillus mishanensis]MQS89377.1 CPBP family intramembrane metalloprotease [Companilactobacillus mishanensis]